MTDSDDAVGAQLAKGIMMAIRATGVMIGADDETIDYAGGVMLIELTKFCEGEGEYGDAVRGLDDGSVPEGEALALVVTACVQQIAVYRQTGIRDLKADARQLLPDS